MHKTLLLQYIWNRIWQPAIFHSNSYGITGELFDDGYTNDVKIYFISSAGKISCVKDSAYGGGALFGKLRNYEKLDADAEGVFLNCGSQKFIIWEIDGGGSSSVSAILGVRNGKFPHFPHYFPHFPYNSVVLSAVSGGCFSPQSMTLAEKTPF